VIGERQDPIEKRTADHLVHRVVASDVLPRTDEVAGCGEEAGCVEPTGRVERRLRLAETIGQRSDERAADRKRALDRRRLDRDRLECPLATDAAG